MYKSRYLEGETPAGHGVGADDVGPREVHQNRVTEGQCRRARGGWSDGYPLRARGFGAPARNGRREEKRSSRGSWSVSRLGAPAAPPRQEVTGPPARVTWIQHGPGADCRGL